MVQSRETSWPSTRRSSSTRASGRPPARRRLHRSLDRLPHLQAPLPRGQARGLELRSQAEQAAGRGGLGRASPSRGSSTSCSRPRRRGRGRVRARSSARDGAGHLRPVQERAHSSRVEVRSALRRRQGLPQRGHAGELPLPQPRVRADGDRVLRAPRARLDSGTSSGATGAAELVAALRPARAELQLREHDRDELAHYAKTGAGTSDIEYEYPIGFGELRASPALDFDLAAQQHSKTNLEYVDAERTASAWVRKGWRPAHVIEPSAGLDHLLALPMTRSSRAPEP